MRNTFLGKSSRTFLAFMASTLVAGSIVIGCGDDTSSKPQEEISDEKDIDKEADKDNGKETDGKDSKEEPGDSTDVLDTFKLDQFVGVYKHTKWTEGALLEISPSMELTGHEFTAKADCDSCPFVFKNLKLQTPYVLFTTQNRASRAKSSYTFVDLSRTDTAYVNALTLLECNRIIKLIKEGAKPEEAEKQAQQEVLKDLLGDTPKLKLSNQISGTEKDSTTKTINTLFPFGNMLFYDGYEKAFEETGKWETDSLKIKLADDIANRYMFVNDDENPKPERKIATGIYARIYGFGECSDKNIDSVTILKDERSSYNKSPFLCSKEYGWYVPSLTFQDIYGWEPGHDGEIRKGNFYKSFEYAYDSILGEWTSEIPREGIACITSNLGQVIKSNDPFFASPMYEICTYSDMGQTFWNTATESQYYTQGLECDTTGKLQRTLVDSTVKLVCDNGTFRKPTDAEIYSEGLECDSTGKIQKSLIDSTVELSCSNGVFRIATALDQREDLLIKEAELAPCGEEESFRKGLIDTTIYYHCYRGDLSIADDFDLAMGRGCNADNVGYFKYQNSIYNCNGFIWKYASDSLVIDSVTDERDGAVYKTVSIGDQVWMAQNLNYAIDSSWSPKPYISYLTDTVWTADSSSKYSDKYGRFYQWSSILGAAPQEEHICPTGFHIPTNKEWEKLVDFSKKWFKNKTAIKIFAASKSLEYSDGLERGDDLLGFSAYLIGYRNQNGFYNGWLYSTLMCSQDSEDDFSYVYMIGRDNSMEFKAAKQKQTLSCNVRCVKD